jgi:hypothetical protein
LFDPPQDGSQVIDVRPSSADQVESSGDVRAIGDRAHALVRAGETALAGLSFAIGGYIFVTTVLMVINSWTAMLLWDQLLDLHSHYAQAFWRWLFSQHNEHRIAIPRLLFAIDSVLFAETNKFTLAFNVLSQLSLTALIAYISGRVAGQTFCEQIWLVGVALALLFSAMQYENFLWGFQVQFVGVVLVAVATFATLGLGRPRAGTLTTVIGLEGIAVYTLASGIVVPFLAVPFALWLRWPRRQVLVLSVAAIALLAVYLYGYVTPPNHSDPIKSIGQLREVVSYLLTEIGTPFGMVFGELHIRHARNWDRLCGVVGIASFAVAATSMIRRGDRGGPIPVLLAAALFVLGTALLTALGRVKFGAAQAMSPKYSTAVLLFWLSLMVIGVIRLRCQDARVRIAAMTAVMPLLLALAYYQPSFAATGGQWVLPRLEATTALLANVDDPVALSQVYPDAAVVKAGALLLRKRNLSIFAEKWSGWLGTPLVDHVHASDPERCRGGISAVAAVGSADPQGWRARGWARDAKGRAGPRRIVIADAIGHVIGYGFSGFPRTGGSEGSDWHGHFTMALPASITAYGLLDGGLTVCPLGHWSMAP